jgi:TRAP-type C4-dicarboxylate transport system permease small subunit
MTAPSPPLPALEPGWPFVLCLLAFLAVALGLRALALHLARERYLAVTGAFERWLLTVILLALVGLSILQIVLRNFFHTGLIWIDPLLRTLVLWLTFLGALAATARGRHIAMDVLSRFLPPRGQVALRRILSLIAGSACIALANGAYAYLRLEIEYGRQVFLGLWSWQVQSILLIGFILLAYRFLVNTIWRAAEEPPEPPIWDAADAATDP